MKTKGYLEEGVRHFLITHEGEQFDVRRTGNQFTCRGFRGTIKAIKEQILSAQLVDETGEETETETFKTAADYEAELGCQPEYDCVDPCALLILYTELNVDVLTHTLDKLGWLNEDGTQDVERAQREYQRFMSKTLNA